MLTLYCSCMLTYMHINHDCFKFLVRSFQHLCGVQFWCLSCLSKLFFVFWEIVAILESLAHQESVLWSPEQVPQIRVLLPASCKGLVGTLGPPRCQDHSRLKTLNSIIPVESLCWLRLHVHRSWDQNVDTLSDCGVFQNSTILQGNPWIHVAIECLECVLCDWGLIFLAVLGLRCCVWAFL